MQLDASPENFERLLLKWAADKSCAICTRSITSNDWRQGRLAVLSSQGELLELRDLPAEDLQMALEDKRPLCWKCHQEERERQPVPHRSLKGERFGMASLHELV